MTMIKINLNSEKDIDEKVFVGNATKITKNIIKSGVLEQSPLKEIDFAQNDTEIDILLCKNETIQDINRDYRGKDAPTDVITFALFADSEPEMRVTAGGEIPLGEIIISLEKIEAQALEHSKTFDEELYFILAHGILHLFGFTHKTEEDLQNMIELQKRLVSYVEI